MNDVLLNLSGYSFERLQNFCAMAERGSIAGAARNDPSRQSLISRQIRELEQFFGVKLVQRSGRGLVLTARGRQLAAVGKQHLSSVRELISGVRSLPERYSLAAPGAVIEWLVLPRMGTLLERFPAVNFAVHHSDSSRVALEVEEGLHDFGVIEKARLTTGNTFRPLGTVTYALAVPQTLIKGRPAAGDLLALAGTLPLALPPGGLLRQGVERLLAKRGVQLRARVECDGYSYIERLIRHGICAGVLPSYAAAPLKEARVFIQPLPLRLERGPLCLTWNRRSLALRPAGEQVKKLLTEVLSLK